MNSDVYVLDACALIALFNDEPGADIVETMLVACEAHEITIRMSAIQVLEVYYDRIYKVGQELADSFLATLYESNILVDRRISDPVIAQAGHYKTTYAVSLADAVCLATAATLDVIVITSDHTEFDPVEEAEQYPFLWVRPKPEPKQGKTKADLQTLIAERDTARRELAEAKRRIAELEAKK
jgi:predicted nucleic acid-binding protein